jgi:hypothetical protein
MERRYRVKHAFTAATVGNGAKAKFFRPGESVWWDGEASSGPVVFKVAGFKWQADDPVEFTQSIEPLSRVTGRNQLLDHSQLRFCLISMARQGAHACGPPREFARKKGNCAPVQTSPRYRFGSLAHSTCRRLAYSAQSQGSATQPSHNCWVSAADSQAGQTPRGHGNSETRP